MSRIITFYSYKGGVGRTLALANIAVLLARRNKRVLLIDWDLEAPGLDAYFAPYLPAERRPRAGTAYLLDRAASGPEANWREHVETVEITGPVAFKEVVRPISLIASGVANTGYAEKVREFSWQRFLGEQHGGSILDRWREEWKAEFDFVLIDSRTGITDSGGICTIMLPDVLALVFSANDQSSRGASAIARSAQMERRRLAVPRPPLSVLPILSRFDRTKEVGMADRWLDLLAARFAPFYDDWLPADLEPIRLLERTKIPYVTLFSFGEPLPVLTHSLTEPELPGFYLEHLARLLESDFQAARSIIGADTGRVPAEPVESPERPLFSGPQAGLCIESTGIEPLPGGYRAVTIDYSTGQRAVHLCQYEISQAGAPATGPGIDTIDVAAVKDHLRNEQQGRVRRSFAFSAVSGVLAWLKARQASKVGPAQVLPVNRAPASEPELIFMPGGGSDASAGEIVTELEIKVFDSNGKEMAGAVKLDPESDEPAAAIDFSLRPGERERVSINADLTRFVNPLSVDSYRVILRQRDPQAGTPGAWFTIDEWMLFIRRSSERTDVSVTVMESEQRRGEPLNKDRRQVKTPFLVGNDRCPRLVMRQAQEALNRFVLCTVRLSNACRDGAGYADWRMGLEVVSSDGLQIPKGALRFVNGRGQPASQGTLRDSPEEPQREQDLLVELDSGRVSFLTRNARLTLNLTVDWAVCEDGALDPTNIQLFQNQLSVFCYLRDEPPRDVLAIDFGTAAIAVAHARGPTQVELLPLAQRLAEIQKLSNIRRRLDDPVEARNHFFLASEFNVCLDDKQLAQTEPDDPAFIDLPLAIPAMYQFPEKCFSSLPTMISAGFATLPLDATLHPYQYQGELQQRGSPPLGAVIAGAYNGLLRNFIEPLLAQGRQGYSHVYITHPNTYTTNHVRQLRGIVEQVFSGVIKEYNVVYPENIHFFSESDAVAYYFLIYAHELRGAGAVVPKRERIFVYDIGAGTLDLTYLEVDWERNESDGFTPSRIRVRRRGGVAKAGNLLDECIARDLHAYLDGTLDTARYLTPVVVANAGERMDETTVRRMDELRQQIHRLKAEMSEGTENPSLELSTPLGAAQLVLTRGDDTPGLYEGCSQLRATLDGKVFWEPGRERLLAGEYVSAFSERVTRTEVLKFFGEHLPKLDTVILSGRTSLWPGLQQLLRSTLGQVPNWVDFNADANTLKNVVVLGMIQREFRWRAVTFEAPAVIGQFGVRYERAHAGDWDFESYENSGDRKTFYLQNASEVQIGLRTNNGFHACYSLLPDSYYGDDNKLTIKLDFDETGYLKADVSNTRGDTKSFFDITNIPQLEYTRLPWPLGAAKLHAMTPEALLGEGRSE